MASLYIGEPLQAENSQQNHSLHVQIAKDKVKSKLVQKVIVTVQAVSVSAKQPTLNSYIFWYTCPIKFKLVFLESLERLLSDGLSGKVIGAFG